MDAAESKASGANRIQADVASSTLSSMLPTSASRDNYDVIVIGAGVIGCCTARELARYDVSVLLLEAGLDIASGATRANSGIVHAGFDPIPGTLKAAYNVRGARMFPAWQQELGFAYYKNGALVVAFNDEEKEALGELQKRGIANGAPETRIIDRNELRALEPNVAPGAIAALLVPDSGVCDPYGFTLATAENAVDNGVEILLNTRVASISAQHPDYLVTCENGNSYTARAVINAAGIHSAELNNLVSEAKLSITARRGEYHLYENTVSAFTHTMFQTPTAKGKGVLVGRVAFGNPFIGPSAEEQESLEDVSTTQEGLDYVMEAASRTWPAANTGNVIANFAGLRATNADTGDFVIGQAADAPGFFNAACIDSPGLACAPAIATDLASQVASYLEAGENAQFNPHRIGAPLLVMMDETSIAALVASDARYANTVCRCCHVTEGEIVTALHRSIPVGCLDALKWRTGATMGPCQGGRCQAKIARIVMDELAASASGLEKRHAGATLVAGKSEAACAKADASATYVGTTPDDLACACPMPDVPAEEEGVFEKPRASYRIPGTRAAGVYSARGAMELMRELHRVPGSNVIIWGETALADECAQLFEQAGATVERVSSERERIALIEGSPRVERVTFESENGSTRRLTCDTLVISAELMKR